MLAHLSYYLLKKRMGRTTQPKSLPASSNTRTTARPKAQGRKVTAFIAGRGTKESKWAEEMSRALSELSNHFPLCEDNPLHTRSYRSHPKKSEVMYETGEHIASHTDGPPGVSTASHRAGPPEMSIASHIACPSTARTVSHAADPTQATSQIKWGRVVVAGYSSDKEPTYMLPANTPGHTLGCKSRLLYENNNWTLRTDRDTLRSPYQTLKQFTHISKEEACTRCENLHCIQNTFHDVHVCKPELADDKWQSEHCPQQVL
jgi:hypothetical protein